MTHRYTDELMILKKENHDHCVSCDYKFQKADTSHLGYDKKGQPLYVCNKCSDLLEETAIRYYYQPKPYETPNPESNLWRFMDFTKYLSLLNSKCLFFCRADKFNDPFEGAKGVIENKKNWDKYYIEFFRDSITHPPEGVDFNLNHDEIKEKAQELLRSMEDSGIHQRKWVYISCWHENEHESEAMWHLYSNYIDNAIAIQTTHNDLYLSLGKDPEIDIGRVKYIDYKKRFAGPNDSYWMKRKSFEHEREVRLLIFDPNCSDEGKLIPCDLDKMVKSVILSPTSPDWFVDLVNDANDKYGLKIQVNKSSLLAEPFY